MIPLAIIRVAEKNLHFINFDSALNNLPNLRPSDDYPLWRDDINFIERDIEHHRRSTHAIIRVVFVPDYYVDGRHAIGLYTREQTSKRLATMLLTDDTAVADRSAWEGVFVDVRVGEWLHGEVVEGV
jgi:hypothetical protein